MSTGDENHSKEPKASRGSILRYVLNDFARGCYVAGALAIDVFLVFQIYVWMPNDYSGLLVILIVLLLGYLEYRIYCVLIRIMNIESSYEDLS